MTTIVLPDIDPPTLAELRERMPSLRLSEIELPSLEDAGRDADRAINRMLGRSRPTGRPWLAVGIGILATALASVWFITWSRRGPRAEPIEPVEPVAPGPTAAAAVVEVETFDVVADDVAADGRLYSAEGGRP